MSAAQVAILLSEPGEDFEGGEFVRNNGRVCSRALRWCRFAAATAWCSRSISDRCRARAAATARRSGTG
jgi:hypothetical protein